MVDGDHREHRPPRGEGQSVDLAGPSEAYELGDRNDHPYPDGEPSDDIDGDHGELQTLKGTAQRYRQQTGRLRRRSTSIRSRLPTGDDLGFENAGREEGS